MKTFKVFCATLVLLALASTGYEVSKKSQKLGFQVRPSLMADVSGPPHLPFPSL